MKNPREAVLLLEGFGPRYQSVPVYPQKDKETRFLFEVAKKIEIEARSQLDQSR
jgi:hypothetical protein